MPQGNRINVANFFEWNRERVLEKVAVCTLSELEAMITRLIVDIYHVRWHRGLKNTPIRRYNESVARHGMKPLPDPKKLAVTLSLVYFRRPQRYGIQFEDLLYDSPQLAIYRTLKGVPQIVTVKVDPNDLTRIWYLDETVGDYVELRVQKSMRNQLQGVTLSLHKMARALQRSNPEVLAGEAGMSKAYAMIRRSLEERVPGRDGLTNRRRAMRALAELRKKAEAMYEDAPAVETAADEGDITDELFGPDALNPTTIRLRRSWPLQRPQQSDKNPLMSLRFLLRFERSRSLQNRDASVPGPDRQVRSRTNCLS